MPERKIYQLIHEHRFGSSNYTVVLPPDVSLPEMTYTNIDEDVFSADANTLRATLSILEIDFEPDLGESITLSLVDGDMTTISLSELQSAIEGMKGAVQ